MEQTQILYDVGSANGVPSGSWTVPMVGNKSSARMIRSVGYPIMAASVCPELQTNTFSLAVPSAGGAATVTLRKALPDIRSLVSLVNNGIIAAYPGFAGSLPQLVERSDGWSWTNPTADPVVITFPTANSQQLILGRQFAPSTYDLTIPANSRQDGFTPDPRLGAVSLTLSFSPGQSYRLELPLLGGYREGVLFRPQSERTLLNSSINSVRATVSFPSIATNLAVTADVRSEISIISDHIL